MHLQQLQLAVTALAAIGALVFSLLSYLHSRKTLHETRLAERRKTLITRLNDFYGPLLTYLSVILGLYRIFIIGKPKGFRTLTYLLDRDQEYETEGGRRKVVLSDSDQKLLDEIIELEKKIEEHIVKNCGLVEDPTLAFSYVPAANTAEIDPKQVEGMGLLAILITHFRVLRMAYEGKIRSEIERYRSWVYPRELDAKLRKNIEALQQELRNLGGQPGA